MKEILKRTFFGLIYVLLVYIALLDNKSKALLLLIFMIFSLKELTQLLNIPYKTILLPSLIIFSGFYLFSIHANTEVLQIVIGFILLTVYLLFIYFTFHTFNLEELSKFFLSFLYITIPFSLAILIDKKLLLSIFIILWAADTFAFLTGKYLGKHKLAPDISPKKTIEGALGGLMGSMIISYLLFIFFDFNQVTSLLKFMGLTIIIVIFGILGDLLESRFKRLAGVKDSGKILPGHGGFLDRLDSFIFAVPFVWAYIMIVL
jgi:phosphatidate cytidylyltransferase